VSIFPIAKTETAAVALSILRTMKNMAKVDQRRSVWNKDVPYLHISRSTSGR
jgi:hypothetical protein